MKVIIVKKILTSLVCFVFVCDLCDPKYGHNEHNLSSGRIILLTFVCQF